MIRTIILSIACISFIMSEEAIKTPEILQSILNDYEIETQKAWKIYDNLCQKATDRAKKDMDIAIKVEMKKNNLEGATAIKAKMDELISGKILADLERKWQEDKSGPSVKRSPLTVDKFKLSRELDGRIWNWNNSFGAVFHSDGTMSPNGTWDLKKGKLIVIIGGINHILTINEENNKVISFDGVTESGVTFKVTGGK